MDITKVTIEENTVSSVRNHQGTEVCSVHHLPCTINWNESAEIESYFYETVQPPLLHRHRHRCPKEKSEKILPNTNTESGSTTQEHASAMEIDDETNGTNAVDFSSQTADNKWYTSSIRGRPLKGRQLTLPIDCKGVIIGESMDCDGWQSLETFDSVMNWVLDSNPEDQVDGVPGALSWLELGKKVCDLTLHFVLV